MDKQKQIEEMECFNCIHADVCAVQKGGVNLQLVDSMGCGYHQPKIDEGSVVITEEEHKKLIIEEALLFAEARKQAVKEFAERLKKDYWFDTTNNGVKYCQMSHEEIDYSVQRMFEVDQKYPNYTNHTSEPDWN